MLSQQQDSMEVTALCIRWLVILLMLLVAHVQPSYSQKSDAAVRIVPTRLQIFEYETISFTCLGVNVSAGWTVRNANEFLKTCSNVTVTSTLSCTIKFPVITDSGEYWCEGGGGERSNTVHITVTDGSVILESPVLPVMDGEDVTLGCRRKTSSNLPADFYRDGLHVGSSSTGEVTIHTVSKSDEGNYKCNISGAGESPESWLHVRDGSVILDSPAVPVMEGDAVTLRCRNKKTSTNPKADFYKDGHFFSSSSTGKLTMHSISKSDEGLYKCRISGAGESLESWLYVRDGSVILDSPDDPVKEGDAVTLRCRNKMTFFNLIADFYKDGHFFRSSSTGEMTIHSVSKSDEGLYKCRTSGAGESPERQLSVKVSKQIHFSRHYFILLWIVISVVLVLQLLVIGLLYRKKQLVLLEARMTDPNKDLHDVIRKDKKKEGAADAADNLSLHLDTNHGTKPQTEKDQEYPLPQSFNSSFSDDDPPQALQNESDDLSLTDPDPQYASVDTTTIMEEESSY